jgi:hypothetical protein
MESEGNAMKLRCWLLGHRWEPQPNYRIPDQPFYSCERCDLHDNCHSWIIYVISTSGMFRERMALIRSMTLAELMIAFLVMPVLNKVIAISKRREKHPRDEEKNHVFHQ